MAASTTPTITSDLSAFSDADLTKATDRAYREAARCWADYRQAPSGDVGRMLLTSAEAADEWFDMLRDEQNIRSGAAVEVRSSDVYLLPDGGTSTVPPLITSTWVKRASRHDLPSKSFDTFAPTEVSA